MRRPKIAAAMDAISMARNAQPRTEWRNCRWEYQAEPK
jgi:hypothetical protein